MQKKKEMMQWKPKILPGKGLTGPKKSYVLFRLTPGRNKLQKFGEMLSVQVMGVAGISSPHLPGMNEW